MISQAILKNNFLKTKGFTLIEVLIVVAITVLIIYISIPIYTNLTKSASADEVFSNLTQSIRLAKAKAQSGLYNSNYGIYIDEINSNFILYKGENYSERDLNADIVYKYNESIDISSNFLNNEIIFKKNTGNVNSEGQINILDEGVIFETLNINKFGYVNW